VTVTVPAKNGKVKRILLSQRQRRYVFDMGMAISGTTRFGTVRARSFLAGRPTANYHFGLGNRPSTQVSHR
jgi:hypothetical protein